MKPQITTEHHAAPRFAALAFAVLTFAALAFALGCSSSSAPIITNRQDVTQEASPSAPTVAHSQTAAVPSFDFYLLTLSWSPEYCQSHPSATECAAHPAFVLHGLWPENADGTYKTNCSNAPGPADPSQYKDIYPDVGLLKHEWSTHGACSGLAPDAFFTAARTAFHSVTIPPRLAQLKATMTMVPNDILALFPASNPGLPRGSLVLSCANNALSAVEVCLDKSLKPIVCGPIKSCRAGSISVTAP